MKKNVEMHAFTLAELLVSILIISVILALLAPVITKRAKENITINSNSGSNTINSKLFTYDKTTPDCLEIAGSTDTLSCSFTVPQGVNRLNAILVSGGGGGAGATQPNIEYSKTLGASTSSQNTSSTKELVITKNMKNFVISNLIGSGAGGGGAAWSGSDGSPQSQAECAPYKAIFVPAAYNGTNGKNLCVTKFNVGDTGFGGPPIAAGVTTVSPYTKCSGTHCCWQGQTSDECYDTHNIDYDGCNRTACTMPAAKKSCEEWAPAGTPAGSWRLPVKTELEGWTQNLDKILFDKGVQGLQLCDMSAFAHEKYNVQCDITYDTCPGSNSAGCLLPYVWSSTFDNYDGYYAFVLSWHRGSVSDNFWQRNAMSARCVYDGSGSSTQKFSTLSGGAGGAGAYVKNYQIPNDIISSNIGGKIVLYAAAGGAGGNSASSSGANASNGSGGNYSYVEVYSPDNVLQWGLRVPGGSAGNGATSTNYGTGGAQTLPNTCRIFEPDTLSWRSTSCTGEGAGGTNGAKVESASSANTAVGGTGGGSMYNTAVAQGGGAGGTTSSANGYNGTTYGAGGGGATIVFDSSNNVTRGKGGSGANGIAEITYDVIHQAAAGGGGGGGAYVEIKDISTSSGNVYTFEVGAGGKGGNIAANGSDGGRTSADINGSIFTLTGGGGGSVGTSATGTSEVVHGTGGSGGIVSSNVSDTTNIEYKNGQNGIDGGSYGEGDPSAFGTIYGGSYGGAGGESAIGSSGGCGGMYTDEGNCANQTVNGIYTQFAAPSGVYSNIEYGSAGAGGGAGGWSENVSVYPTPGSGAQGQGGYVFIYWRE